MEGGKTGIVRMPNTINEMSVDDLMINCTSIIKSQKKKYILPNNANIYFAAPWFTEKGKILYDTCQGIAELSGTTYNIFYPRNQVNKTPKQAFNNNVKHIADCTALVALVSEKDIGTAWEIGVAYALGKPIFLLGYDETTFLSHTNVMLAFTGKCMTLKEYSKFLTNDNPKFVKIDNSWEGKE